MKVREKILIIDDDPDALLYLSEFLEDHEYETLTAADGEAGLEKARESRPDAVLLDLMMPKRGGVWFLNEIRKDQELKDIPIVVESGATELTGVNMKDYLEKQPFKERKQDALGYDVDIAPDAYLDKPINEDELLVTLHKLIRKA